MSVGGKKNDYDCQTIRKGKPGENQGRKVMGLRAMMNNEASRGYRHMPGLK